jgi:pimeloyl-ACP methyl ester carboxylesterase
MKERLDRGSHFASEQPAMAPPIDYQQTHLGSREIYLQSEISAFFALRPQEKAVLFIHGFSGNAQETWPDFPGMAQKSPKFDGRDLYFYGYDGVQAGIESSAAIFRVFLERLFEEAAEMVNHSVPHAVYQRHVEFRYGELHIVAHSLGAVIARRALLDATRQNKWWVSHVKLVLFAPAHCGAKVVDLALMAASSLSWMGGIFSAITQWVSPLVPQLHPDSPQIKALWRDTELACAGGQAPHLIAQRVIIAHYENIVENVTFVHDPPPLTIPGTTHQSVCKPTETRRSPLNHLEDCL